MNSKYQAGEGPAAQKLSRLMATKSFFKSFADRTQAYNFKHVLSLVIFNSQIEVRCNFTEFFKSFKFHVDKIQAQRGTKLFDALEKGKDMLNNFAREKYSNVLKRIVCLTDGEDVGSVSNPLNVLRNLINSNILVDSFIPGGRYQALKSISFATGGSCFKPKSVIEGIQLFESQTVLKANIRANAQGKINLEEEKLDSLKNLIARYNQVNYTQKPQQMKRPNQLSFQSTSARKILKKVKKTAPPPSTVINPSNLLKMKRVFRELHNLDKEPHPDVKVFPTEDNPLFWNLLFNGPIGTPYFGYVFHGYASFPDQYPRQPPIIRFLTPIYHCNINSDGRICHSIFDRNYSPSVTIREILNHIFALLMTPQPKDPLDNKRAQEFFSNRDIYNSNVRKQCETHAYKSMAQAESALLGTEMTQELKQVDTQGLPKQCVCSLTKRLIKKPAYLKVDDRNYELDQIRNYVRMHKKSPVNGKPALESDIVEIPMLLKMIEQFRAQSVWFDEDD